MSTISSILPKIPDNFSTQISDATVSSSALSITLDSVAGLPTEGVGQLFKKNTDGEIIQGSIEFIHWTDISGNALILTDIGDRGLTGSDSGAQSYVADDYFEIWVSSYYQLDEESVVSPDGEQTLSNKTLVSPNITGMAGFEARKETIYSNGNSGTSKEIDWANGSTQSLTLTGNCTLTFANAVAGQYLTLLVTVDATGGYTITIPSSIGVSGTTITKTANAKNAIAWRYDGTSYWLVGVVDNATAITSL
jgi:hypothetical protein